MHRPVLVAAPAILATSVEEVKAFLNILHSDWDEKIEREIRSAVDRYDGWTGIIRRYLVEQTWRQDFDCFKRCLHLPLGPVSEIVSVKWRNSSGQIATVAASEYSLQTDAGGRSHVRFKDDFSAPGDLYEVGAVQAEFKGGYPVVGGKSTVPHDIKTAIAIRVQMMVDEVAKDGLLHLERAESALLSKYGPVGI